MMIVFLALSIKSRRTDAVTALEYGIFTVVYSIVKLFGELYKGRSKTGWTSNRRPNTGIWHTFDLTPTLCIYPKVAELEIPSLNCKADPGVYDQPSSFL